MPRSLQDARSRSRPLLEAAQDDRRWPIVAVGANVDRDDDALSPGHHDEIFDALRWTMGHCKLVIEGAAAAPIAALRRGLIKAPAGAKVVCVLSGGNVNLDQLKGLRWN